MWRGEADRFRTRVKTKGFEHLIAAVLGAVRVRGGVRQFGRWALPAGILTFAVALPPVGVAQASADASAQRVPPTAALAQRFLRQRGMDRTLRSGTVRAVQSASVHVAPQVASSIATWQSLGPVAVVSPSFGLVTGRVSTIAFDPSDVSGNTAYIGTTGGGVWLSENAAATNFADVTFRPLTDSVGALQTAQAPSISIGAVTVQPGGTGVILAGTGDSNDALDSYYGAGLLRSIDGGVSWSLIKGTADALWSFAGEGFAGFAWSTTNTQLVVAAVSQAYTGVLVDAPRAGSSYEGLYYSTDAGATWSLATISDGNGSVVQGATATFDLPDGNAATSVVWNPVRHMFLAAVRYHGYYQSTDGITWTRLTAQPGYGLTTQACPTHPGSIGSVACPIFRGTLAVNPVTGDTFAWTVDANNQDQGIWQDACALSAGVCGSQTISFARQINTTALEIDQPPLGAVTIANGDFNLALAAVPSAQDTLLLVGANDLWKCSLAAGCVWRNATNSTSCMSAKVAEYQHALAWNPSNPLQVLIGNDSGLWRSTDAVAESGAVCSMSDATHFQNLNGGLGSLSDVVSLSQVTTSPYALLAGLGVNGAAGVKSTSGPVADWPQVLDGEGGSVAIDPTNPSKWYVNNQAGASIHLCSQTSDCTAADFGTTPVVSNADVGGDGYTMLLPAPFLVDPLDPSQLLVGTCRVWRGPADGSAWTSANAISPFLDGLTGVSYCNGDALIRSMAVAALPGGGEVIYVGMYGSLDGGATLAGHVFSATFIPGSSTPVWRDLTANPVTNDTQGLNIEQLDISSIFIDPHDTTGKTVYVTVQGVREGANQVRTIYRSTDGGAHWAYASFGLPYTAANSLVVDPQDANIVYVATDAGVFVTQQITSCVTRTAGCWTIYGAGLPQAPVTQLSASPQSVSPNVLVAGTFGRGIWQIPLLTAGTQLTTASVDPTALDFGSVAYGTLSSPQTITLTNTGGIALAASSITVTGDFTETDNCQSVAVNAGASCAIQVTFTPSQSGSRTGELTISANVSGGQLTAELSGTGGTPGSVSLSPTQINFGQVQAGTTSSPLAVTVQNLQAGAISISSVSITSPFVLQSNTCGNSLAGNSSCQFLVAFAPTQAGTVSGILSLIDSTGTQTAQLSGTGASVATDSLSPMLLTFAGTVVGQTSPTQTISLTNSGDLALESIAVAVSGPFTVSSTCGAQLAGHSSCAIGAVFAPVASGSAAGTLTVTDALRSQSVTLSGTGLQPPTIAVSPTSLSFAAQQVGVASSPLTLTVTNIGGAPMAGLTFSITGTSAGSFSTGTATCATTLVSGASCTVQVVFTPAGAGGSAATLTVASPTPGVKPVAISLSGAASSSAGLNVRPAQMSFSVATLGQASAAQIATISNIGSTPASGLALATSAPFSLTQDTCGASLAGGSSCTVGVIFTPSANGTAAGALSISSTNLISAVVLLSGAGGAVGSSLLQPASLVFPITAIGVTSSAQTIAVTNTSPVALTDLALTVSSGFQINATTCASPLAAGASCTVSISFAPSVSGSQAGTLTVSSSALATDVQAALTGTGFDFTVAIGSAIQSIASGQTATFGLTLTPLGGVAAGFTYSCGTLPANTSCSFNPATTSAAANSTGSVLLSVVTGHAVTATVRPPARSGWGPAIALCGVLLLPVAWCRRHRALLLVALLAILSGGATGCVASGGGTSSSGTSGSGSTTPAGTYTIVVTAKSNGASHDASLTLTVD
jgi:hypothetical protein